MKLKNLILIVLIFLPKIALADEVNDALKSSKMTIDDLIFGVRGFCPQDVSQYKIREGRGDDEIVNTTISQYIYRIGQMNMYDGSFSSLERQVEFLKQEYPKVADGYKSGALLEICTLRYIGSLRGNQGAKILTPAASANTPPPPPLHVRFLHPVRQGGDCFKIFMHQAKLEQFDKDGSTNRWNVDVTFKNICPYAINVVAGRSTGYATSSPISGLHDGHNEGVIWPDGLKWPELTFKYQSPTMPSNYRFSLAPYGAGHDKFTIWPKEGETPKVIYKSAYCQAEQTLNGEIQYTTIFHDVSISDDFEKFPFACVSWSWSDVERARANDPRLQQFKPSNAAQSDEDNISNANRLLAANDFSAAQKAFASVLKQLPATDPRQSNLRFLLGRSYIGGGKPALAAKTFYENYNTYPKGPFAGQSLAELGFSLVGLGELKTACATFSEFHGAFSGVDLTDKQAEDFIKNEAIAGCPQKFPRW